MKLHPSLRPKFEAELAANFRKHFIEPNLKLEPLGDPRILCRALLRATYDLAFEKLEHAEAVQLLAAALNELNGEHAVRPG